MTPIEPTLEIDALPAAPSGKTPFTNHSIEFTGSGSEYFRIWIVNLLLILVTLGIYLPWAKVRKIKYFYGNTLIDGHALDFHGEPKKMLRGTVLVGIFFVLYAQAFNVSPWAGMVASVAIIALWPLLFRASLRFRLGNTSWRGLRFSFSGDLKEAVFAISVPLALFLIPVGLLSISSDGVNPKTDPKLAMGYGLGFLAVMAFFALLVPYFFWRSKRYQHSHYNYGSLRTELRCTSKEVYAIFLKTLLVMVALGLVAGVVIALTTGVSMANFKAGRRATAAALLATTLFVLIMVIVFNAVVKSYWVTRTQNLVWTRTGNPNIRFISELALGRFTWQQFKNYALIVLTLGLYWPFAVIATQRMRIQAVTLRSRVGLDSITAAAQANSGAVGDAAVDMFDMDIGV
jgi:uncharacterized membrane protein YjgN (DUF898 family)